MTELFDITMGAFALAKMFQLYRHYYIFMCPFFFSRILSENFLKTLGYSETGVLILKKWSGISLRYREKAPISRLFTR